MHDQCRLCQYQFESGSSHAMRNEMYLRLNGLYRPIQFSCLFLVQGSEISLSYGKRRAMKDASSLFADEVVE